jgi:Flp pilus assembly pilin Flp
MDPIARPGNRRGLSKGQTMMEYVLIISAIAIAVMSAYGSLGLMLKGIVTAIAAALP